MSVVYFRDAEKKNHNRKIGTGIRIRIYFEPQIRIHSLQRLIRVSGSTIPERWIRGSGSTIPKYGSQDLDPSQNEMDPQHCKFIPVATLGYSTDLYVHVVALYYSFSVIVTFMLRSAACACKEVMTIDPLVLQNKQLRYFRLRNNRS